MDNSGHLKLQAEAGWIDTLDGNVLAPKIVSLTCAGGQGSSVDPFVLSSSKVTFVRKNENRHGVTAFCPSPSTVPAKGMDAP